MTISLGNDGKGNEVVRLVNPWGFQPPDPVPLSQLSQIYDEIDVAYRMTAR
jgi:hypothetical protein